LIEDARRHEAVRWLSLDRCFSITKESTSLDGFGNFGGNMFSPTEVASLYLS
jgi:hypothetical protein